MILSLIRRIVCMARRIRALESQVAAMQSAMASMSRSSYELVEAHRRNRGRIVGLMERIAALEVAECQRRAERIVLAAHLQAASRN